jgi:hypothetical protein
MIKQDPTTGFYFYDTLPSGWRIATPFDFDDIIGCVQKRMPFLVKGFHSGKFECYRVQESFKIHKIMPWIECCMVYVLDK